VLVHLLLRHRDVVAVPRHRKGHTRFHAVYWSAMLLSAGLLVPTRISCIAMSRRKVAQHQVIRSDAM
jgi:hypothetical protein